MSITLNTYPNTSKPLAINDRAATWGILPSSPVPSNVNYQITFQGKKFRDNYNPSSAIEAFTSEKVTDAIIRDSTVLQTPINLNRYLQHLLYNDLTNNILFTSSLKFDRGAWAKFKIDFKEMKLVSGVMTETDTESSAYYKVINARLNGYEVNLNDYAFAYGTTQAKFLNQRPTRFVYPDEYVNLYFVLQSPIEGNFNYRVVVSGVKQDNSSYSENYLVSTTANAEYILIIPSGVINGILVPNDIKTYSIKVQCSDATAGTITWVDASLPFSFEVIDCDCCTEEMYFQSEKGAFDTIRFERIDSKDITVSQTEILRDVITLAGGETLDAKLLGMTNQINTQSSEKITFLSEEVMMNDKEIDYFRQFKQSERRYLKTTVNGQTKAVAFIVEPSETRVWQYGDSLRLQVTGYLGNSQLL